MKELAESSEFRAFKKRLKSAFKEVEEIKQGKSPGSR